MSILCILDFYGPESVTVVVLSLPSLGITTQIGLIQYFCCFSPKVQTIDVFCAIGFFNKADKLESSSILVYCHLKRGFYTRRRKCDSK
jgi:hypothetical protein